MNRVAEYVLVSVAAAGAVITAGFLTLAVWVAVCEVFRPTLRLPRTPACPESDEVYEHRLAVLDADRLDPAQYRGAR